MQVAWSHFTLADFLELRWRLLNDWQAVLPGGEYGACRAIMQLPEQERPLTIAFDSVPSTVEMMRKGIVKAILYQHPTRQGRMAISIAFEYLVNGRMPDKKNYIMKNEIRLLENL